MRPQLRVRHTRRGPRRPRYSHGFPQILGRVELPIADVEGVSDDATGSIVTVLSERSAKQRDRTVAPQRAQSRLKLWTARAGALSPNVAVVVISLAAFVGLTAFLYALSVHADAPNSDGATLVLEARSMAHGSLTLHGWSLSLDSFWGVDTVIYLCAVVVAGVHASYLHLIPALISAAVVVGGAHLAWKPRRDLAGFAGALTVAALIAFPSEALARNLLVGGTHVGTALWCLIAFVALRSRRFGWRWLIAVIILAAGMLGDLQTVAYGTAPVLLAGVAASARCRRWIAGLPAMSAALASVTLALILREISVTIGTFALISPQPLPSLSKKIHNFALLGNYLPKVFGVGTGEFGSGGQPHFTEFARGISFIVVIAAVAIGVAGLIVGCIRGKPERTDEESAWPLDDVLSLALVGGLVMFIAITPQPLPAYARYLVPSTIFGAILTGRLVSRAAGRLFDQRAQLPRSIPIATTAAFVAIVAVQATGAGYELAQPVPFNQYQAGAKFLEQHKLYYGVGDYWSSSIVTVSSNDAVRVRAVTQWANGKLVRYSRESSRQWYSGKRFQFLIYNPGRPFGNVNAVSATATFGVPERAYHVDGLEVLVWRHPFTVAPNGTTS